MTERSRSQQLKMNMEQVNQLKEKGNIALASGQYSEAIKHYTEAIALDLKNYVLYSNRSDAYAKSREFHQALEDAEKTIELNPTWSKGYSRKGRALQFLGKTIEAQEAYKKGLELDLQNQQLVEAARKKAKDFISKLQAKPETREWLKDPEYVEAVKKLAANLCHVDSILSDVRVLKAFPILFGFEDFITVDVMPEPKTEEPPKPSRADLPEHRRLALEEKDLGNDAYKRKDFDNAIQHYKKAIEHDPANIIFYTNMAAVYFEQKEYEKCIKECEKAIDVGRENRADFKLIAKAFTRIGNAYKKMEQWKLAKTYYEKSMSEHRTPEIKTLLSEVEKKIVEQEKKAYVDPVKAEGEGTRKRLL